MEFTRRQQQIIDTSIELIAERGIQELTIKNLSKKIGIAESAIYRHFKSKLDILLGILALFRQSKEQMNNQLAETEASPSQKLQKMLLGRFAYFSVNRAIAAVIFSEELFRNDRRLSEQVYQIMQDNQQVINHIITAGQQSGEFRNDVPAKEMAVLITGALRLIVTQWRIADYGFDLMEAGQRLGQTIKKLIENNS